MFSVSVCVCMCQSVCLFTGGPHMTTTMMLLVSHRSHGHVQTYSICGIPLPQPQPQPCTPTHIRIPTPTPVTHIGTPIDMVNLVHCIAQTSGGKLAFGIRLKYFLVTYYICGETLFADISVSLKNMFWIKFRCFLLVYEFIIWCCTWGNVCSG